LSPYSNLFNKHVGNVYNRYVLTESIFERILQSLFGINDSAFSAYNFDSFNQKVDFYEQKRPKIELLDPNETTVLALSNLLTKVAAERDALETKLVQTEAELNEFKLNLSRNEERKEECDQELDTCLVAERVKECRVKFKVSLGELSERVLGITRSYLTELLEHPQPWCDLNLEQQSLYRKLLSWCIETERGSGTSRLNAAELSKKIRELLCEHGIGFSDFANRKLYVTKSYFLRLIADSTEWEKLNRGDKDLFRRIQKWTRASREDFESLKNQIANCHMKFCKK
jgi:hypothetical protein